MTKWFLNVTVAIITGVLAGGVTPAEAKCSSGIVIGGKCFNGTPRQAARLNKPGKKLKGWRVTGGAKRPTRCRVGEVYPLPGGGYGLCRRR